MIPKDFFRHLIFTFMVSSLQGGLRVFYGTLLRCNSLEWGPRESPEDPETGSGSGGDARPRLWHVEARIPLRGRTFLWGRVPLRPPRSHHSASSRLALHPKNHTFHLVQLPDLG